MMASQKCLLPPLKAPIPVECRSATSRGRAADSHQPTRNGSQSSGGAPLATPILRESGQVEQVTAPVSRAHRGKAAQDRDLFVPALRAERSRPHEADGHALSDCPGAGQSEDVWVAGKLDRVGDFRGLTSRLRSIRWLARDTARPAKEKNGA
jgi:hypothetical protein